MPKVTTPRREENVVPQRMDNLEKSGSRPMPIETPVLSSTVHSNIPSPILLSIPTPSEPILATPTAATLSPGAAAASTESPLIATRPIAPSPLQVSKVPTPHSVPSLTLVAATSTTPPTVTTPLPSARSPSHALSLDGGTHALSSIGIPQSENSPPVMPHPEHTPIGKPQHENAPIGIPQTEDSSMGMTVTEDPPMGLPQDEHDIDPMSINEEAMAAFISSLATHEESAAETVHSSKPASPTPNNAKTLPTPGVTPPLPTPALETSPIPTSFQPGGSTQAQVLLSSAPTSPGLDRVKSPLSPATTLDGPTVSTATVSADAGFGGVPPADSALAEATQPMVIAHSLPMDLEVPPPMDMAATEQKDPKTSTPAAVEPPQAHASPPVSDPSPAPACDSTSVLARDSILSHDPIQTDNSPNRTAANQLPGAASAPVPSPPIQNEAPTSAFNGVQMKPARIRVVDPALAALETSSSEPRAAAVSAPKVNAIQPPFSSLVPEAPNNVSSTPRLESRSISTQTGDEYLGSLPTRPSPKFNVFSPKGRPPIRLFVMGCAEAFSIILQVS